MEQLYPTTHNSAAPADFAKTVLMPGDPLRAQKIAKEYLTDAKLVNNVRGVQGYTGTFHGKRVSVMASGMGMPSMGIYSYELFRIYGVENIIRIGSAGALREDIHVRDLVLGMGASTDSAYASNFGLPGTFAPICSYRLLSGSVRLAEQAGFRYHVGNLLSSDVFYSDDPTANARWAKMGILAVEMEAAALYMNAARLGKNALAICTVSNHLLTGEETTPEERQNSFSQMIELALELA
ncbi:MAG: purine-nucleoside phosphorylase [Eubacteriales bacterium]|nr:purine-nucleoside phosphorylase [Eubacteriales bacterium]